MLMMSDESLVYKINAPVISQNPMTKENDRMCVCVCVWGGGGGGGGGGGDSNTPFLLDRTCLHFENLSCLLRLCRILGWTQKKSWDVYYKAVNVIFSVWITIPYVPRRLFWQSNDSDITSTIRLGRIRNKYTLLS